MKICFFGTRMDLLSGHSRPAFELADQLMEQGHEIRIVTTGNSSERGARHQSLLLRSPQLARVPVERPFESVLGMLLRPAATRRSLQAVLEWADVVHGFSFPALAALTEIVTFHRPLVISMSVLPNRRLEELFRLGGSGSLALRWRIGRIPQAMLGARMSRYLARFDRILCWSQFMAGILRTRHVDQTRLVHLPIAIDTRRFSLSEPPARPGAPVFLYLGWCAPFRGPAVLLRAFRQVLRELPQARLILADRGPHAQADSRLHAGELRRLKALIGSLDIQRSVTWRGFEPDISQAIAQSDIVVLPFTAATGYSHPPLTLLESMAHGRPVISTNVGSIPEYLQHGREGLLAQPGDVQDLADQMLAASRSDLRAMGKRARERVGRLDSWEAIASRTAELYAALVAGDAPQGSRIGASC